MPQTFAQLRIDSEFKRLIPPLAPEEFDQLRESLILDGCRDSICTWNDVILDGHNRYEICLLEDIQFTIRKLEFSCREAAIVWICTNQIGRRNITEETRRYLIGKRYEAEKRIGPPNIEGVNQHSPEVAYQIDTQPLRKGYGHVTAIALADEYKLAFGTVVRYGRYAEDMDRISERADGLAPKLLSGQIKVPIDIVHQLSRLPEKEYNHACGRITNGRYETLAYCESRKLLSGSFKRRDQRKESVKDMPIYDPDAEIASLTLTIPSWRSSIERVRTQTSVNSTSLQARYHLSHELSQLSSTIKRMQKVIKEGM
jgi:hypothetical protein